MNLKDLMQGVVEGMSNISYVTEKIVDQFFIILNREIKKLQKKVFIIFLQMLLFSVALLCLLAAVLIFAHRFMPWEVDLLMIAVVSLFIAAVIRQQ